MSGDRCTAFQGTTRIASGPLAEVAAKVKRIVDAGEPSTILIFDDVTAEPVEVDFRGPIEDVIARLTEDRGAPSSASSPARSRSCRGIGNGSRGSREVRRSLCANSSMRQDGSMARRIEGARHKRLPIDSCRRSPATNAVSRRRRGRYLPEIASASARSLPPGPTIFAIMP